MIAAIDAPSGRRGCRPPATGTTRCSATRSSSAARAIETMKPTALFLVASLAPSAPSTARPATAT